ncbi:MAG: Gfo/Idh/MocA family oxidoreductase [candidate division KSB1 bacterium]|nr:Gfo/Idh/MocA family oxidoreductase [candidate division KSB1 bacterium]
MKSVRVGVVGVGHLGRLHALLYNKVPHAQLAGVFDISQETARAVALEAGCRAFDSYADLLAEADAVNVVVPTTRHFEVAAEALRQGKHVFIEKPITSSLAEADELIRLAGEHGCLIQVGHIERFNQAMRALSTVPLGPRFIESHRLATFNPRGTDVAVVLDLMIHDIDIILTLVKSPVVRIEANGVAVISDEPDIANARITFANGCVANVTASRISQKKMRKMRLFEKDSYISIDFLQGITERFRLVANLPESEPTGVIMGKLEGKRTRYVYYERLQAPEGNALQIELEEFVQAILNGRRPRVTAEDGRNALAVATQISEIIKRQSTD